jgi:hypothetical protein
MTGTYQTLNVGSGWNRATRPGSWCWRAPIRITSSRTAALFAQGLPTRGPPELDLGDRIGAL